MNTNEYINTLFSDYEDSQGLRDFKEELQSNLNARVANLIRKGLSEQDAFNKACLELGDISVLANELSLKKRREVFEEVYMDIRKYMNGKRVAAYVTFGIIALFGVIVAVIGYFDSIWPLHNGWLSDGEFPFDESIIVLLGALMPFIAVSIAGFTYLGLTQETRSHFPMSRKRALWYALAALLLGFGIFIVPVTYFSSRYTDDSLVSTIGALIPFALPGGGVLAYLLLTEKNRLKPWAISSNAEMAKYAEIWHDPVFASRFGMFSGAIWIFSAGLFILLGFLVGFRYSWLVFIFAVAVQLLVQGFMVRRKT